MTATVLVLQHPDIARCDLSGLPSADLVSATVARIKVDAGFSLSEQAAAALAARERGEQAAQPSADDGSARLVNSCFAYAADGPVVRERWPHLYTGPKGADAAD